MNDIILSERDYLILKAVYRFRFLTGKHIKYLANYGTLRSTDRRLKTLLESGYLERKKYLYGFPYLYTLSHKSRILLSVNKRAEKLRIEQIPHDIGVLDCVIYYLTQYDITLDDILTEKEMHVKDGFGNRKHAPDFVIYKNDEKIAFEIELTPKQEHILRKNVKLNYLNNDKQVWITDNNKVKKNLENLQKEFDLEIIDLRDIKNGY